MLPLCNTPSRSWWDADSATHSLLTQACTFTYAHVPLQGIQLQVVGALGRGTSGTCTLTGASISIFGTTAAGEPNIGDMVYSNLMNLPGTGDGGGTPAITWSWNTNQTAVVSFDLVDLQQDGPVGPSRIDLQFQTTYWLRAQLVAPYVGSNTARWVRWWCCRPAGAALTVQYNE